MPDLVAQGDNSADTWRLPLPSRPVKLGRREDKSDWAAGWDKQISGLHALLTWKDGKLLVERLPDGKNPIFFQGAAQDQFTVVPGDQFVIGKTTFVLQESQPSSTPDQPPPLSELTLSPQELKRIPFID